MIFLFIFIAQLLLEIALFWWRKISKKYNNFQILNVLDCAPPPPFSTPSSCRRQQHKLRLCNVEVTRLSEFPRLHLRNLLAERFKMSKEKRGLCARVNFPLYCVEALDSRHVLVAGGGGPANTGVKNGFVSDFHYFFKIIFLRWWNYPYSGNIWDNARRWQICRNGSDEARDWRQSGHELRLSLGWKKILSGVWPGKPLPVV